MRFKSLIQAALGVCATILLTGCYVAYVNPLTGSSQKNPPTSNQVKAAQATPGSFASQNPNADFNKPTEYQSPGRKEDMAFMPQLPKPAVSSSSPTGTPGSSGAGALLSKPAVASSSSPTGTPGSSAAGAAATTGPMISSPPAPAPAPAPHFH